MSLLSKRLDRVDASYNHQRFILSGQKQRDMFMDEVMKRLRRMNSRRLGNQDAQATPRLLHQLQKAHTNRFSMGDFELIDRTAQFSPKGFSTQYSARRSSWVPSLSEKRSLDGDMLRPRL